MTFSSSNFSRGLSRSSQPASVGAPASGDCHDDASPSKAPSSEWSAFLRHLEASKDASIMTSARFNPAGLALRSALAPGAQLRSRANADRVSLPTVCQFSAAALRYPCQNPRYADSVVIGFHGNGCTAGDMESTWQRFAAYGTVLAVNAPGYGGTPAPANGAELELHMAAVAQAALTYARQTLGAKRLTWYGLSLGGTSATIGFAMSPGSNLVLHNTLTSARGVAAEVLERQVGSWRPVAQSVATVAAQGLPVGRSRPGLHYVTDGLDTLGKLSRCAATHHDAGSRVLVVGAGRDEIMGAQFAEDLWRAFYGDDDAMRQNLNIMPGVGHNAPIAGAAAAQLERFMQRP